ncbi:hypothetical protein HPB48_022312 [Haemaphysalis longicornis]|uniref:Uncharacterized protein n=1 Tax=Haemaphysalis longicornis TaxID=44386 RepID=A0A9J6FY70_HAELO|nr:hypothetical protein HPB48_022312 [Haemaphysalis longicornis]
MAYVPPNAEQTTLRVVIDGVEENVYLLHNPDGSPMQDDSGCYLYETSGGQHVTLRFTAAGDENLPPPAQPQTSACTDGDDGEAALAEDEAELWSARRTKFFIAQYTALKDLVGKSRTLRYVILCVQNYMQDARISPHAV